MSDQPPSRTPAAAGPTAPAKPKGKQKTTHPDRAAAASPGKVNYRSLAEAVQDLKKDYGQHAIPDLNADRQFIPTGIPQLNLALGTPGLAHRTILEIWGRESTGKSLIAATVCAAAQEAGIVSVYADWEDSLDGPFLRKTGLKTNNGTFIPLSPVYMEDGFDQVNRLLATNQVGLVVLDSAGAMIPKAYEDKEAGYTRPGGVSLPLSICMQQLKATLQQTNAAVIIINQVRMSGFGSYSGAKETTPGGNVLKFFAHQRIRLIRQELIKGPDGTVVGQKVKLRAEKNKRAAPFAESSIRMLYDKGVDRAGSLLDALTEHGIITVSAQGWIESETLSLKIRGKDNLTERLRTDLALQDRALTALAAVQPKSRYEKIELGEEE